jgi:TetR/AcrR family transcriptional regulator, regulator of biofilm formation and stress response
MAGMGRMSVAERRDSLVAAAIRVAERDGVAATTTRAIAAEAGVSLATVHYCFASKQELLEGVLTAIVTELADAAQAELPPGDHPGVLLRDGLRRLWEVVEREPGRQQVTYELTQAALRTEGMAGFARWQYEVQHDLCRRHLEAVARAARVDWTLPMPVLARMLLTVVDGAVLGWLVDRDGATARRALDALAESIGGFSRPAGS